MPQLVSEHSYDLHETPTPLSTRPTLLCTHPVASQTSQHLSTVTYVQQEGALAQGHRHDAYDGLIANLVLVALFQESVIEHDTFALAKTIHVCIAVAAAL
jgi:hypothetical protein